VLKPPLEEAEPATPSAEELELFEPRRIAHSIEA
jgi:hypothetical protein